MRQGSDLSKIQIVNASGCQTAALQLTFSCVGLTKQFRTLPETTSTYLPPLHQLMTCLEAKKFVLVRPVSCRQGGTLGFLLERKQINLI